MTLEEAIKHARDTTENRTDLCDECRAEHKQLAEWLEQLVKLTEENERMRAEAEKLRKENIELNLKNQLLYDEGKTWYAEYHKTKEDLKQEKMYKRASEKLADKYCAELQTSKANTVREMQTEINKTLSALCKGDVSEIRRMIDQIAKEMLEGNDG